MINLESETTKIDFNPSESFDGKLDIQDLDVTFASQIFPSKYGSEPQGELTLLFVVRFGTNNSEISLNSDLEFFSTNYAFFIQQQYEASASV